MKWFKHSTDSLAKNTFMFELIQQFGSDGYLVFFATLEAMADEFDIFNPGINCFPVGKLTKLCQLSRQKVTKILTFCDQKAKENQNKNVAFYATIKGDYVTLSCPKLKEMADEWTNKQLKKLGSNSGVSRDLLRTIESESEKEEEKNIDDSATGVADLQNIKAEKTKKHYSVLVGDLLPKFKILAESFKSLPQKKEPFNPYEFIQKKLKEGYHPQVIFDALQKIHDYWDSISSNPYAYSRQFIHQNQKQKEAEGWKKMQPSDLAPDVQAILKSFFQGIKGIPPGESEKARKDKLREQAEFLRNNNTSEERLYV